MDNLLISVSAFLSSKGYDLVSDQNFVDTPRRFLSWFDEFTANREQCVELAKEILSKKFPSDYQGIVLVQDVLVFSLCPHHLLPVKMNVSFAYIPDRYVVGISKIPRYLGELAKALWLQEDYTQVALRVFDSVLSPQGVMVIVEGEHLCMKMRGVEEPDSTIQTMAVSGAFEDQSVKIEVLNRLNIARGVI